MVFQSNSQKRKSNPLQREMLVKTSDMQRQLQFRCKGAFTHRAMPAWVAVHDAYVLSQIAAT